MGLPPEILKCQQIAMGLERKAADLGSLAQRLAPTQADATSERWAHAVALALRELPPGAPDAVIVEAAKIRLRSGAV